MEIEHLNDVKDEYNNKDKNIIKNNVLFSLTNVNFNNELNTEHQTTTSQRCPMNELTTVDILPNLTIYLIITPEVKLHMSIHMEYSISNLKEKVAKYFGVDMEDFILLFDDNLQINDEETKFSELNFKHNDSLEVMLTSDNNTKMSSKYMLGKIRRDTKLSTDKTIFVHSKNLKTDEVHTTRVDMEKLQFFKHFLGGFRHKKTQIEYHHAVTQTRPRPKLIPKNEMTSRDTQTYKIKNTTIDNVVTTCTQMTKTGYYVSNVTDKLVIPGTYKTADELESFILTKIIIIQKYYRRWLAKRRVEKLRKIRQLILDYELSEINRKAKDKSRRLQVLFDKRRCPLYNDDFDLLYHALELWRLKHIANIDPKLPISEQKALKCLIMDEQHEWLLAIERLRIRALKVLNFRAKKNKLVKVSKPVTWKDKFNNIIQMDLMNTTRGKEVYEIYKSLSMEFFNEEERLDILLTLKRLINNRQEKICSDLLCLINREADLIMRNVSMNLLEGLRTRINTLFLLLCRMPSFNPGVKKYLKVPNDPLDLRGSFQLCRFCNNFLKNNQFMFSVKSKKIGACRTCTRLHNQSMPRLELSPFRLVLSLLQKSEEEYQDNSKMAFIFSEIDIKHLICKIWDSKSILSSNEDLEDLIFIRWNTNIEWSPWNTALMTSEEAEAHYKIKEPCSGYNEKLLDKIHHKQVIGFNYFASMNELKEKFNVHNLKEETERIEAAKLADKEKFIRDKAVRFM